MPIKVECYNCGEETYKSWSKLKRAKRNFCDNKCKYEYFRKNPEIMANQRRLVK